MSLFKEVYPEVLIDDNGIRLDGRKFDELRPIKLEVGVLDRPDGSALIEMGKNRILASVYGPREVHPRHLAQPDRVVCRTIYRMATFAVPERISPAPSRREHELSKIINEALTPSIFVEFYPKTIIDINIQVLSADGGTRCASIIAASLALANAGIALRDLTCAVAAGKVNGQIVLDLSDIEDKAGQGDLPVAMMPTLGQISLLQFDGELTRTEFNQCLDLAVKGIKKINQMQKEALKAIYQK